MFSIIGTIKPPGFLSKYGSPEVGNNNENFGLMVFASNILKLFILGAGLFAFFNLILAGAAFISSQGNPEIIKKTNASIWNSLIGLIIIAASFVIAAIIGFLLFGDAMFIIKPTIYGVGV